LDIYKKIKKIKLDLKTIGLYHSFDGEMLPIENGIIEISYLRSYIKEFYIEPTNYIYSSDQINHTSRLHDLTISQQTLDNILYNQYENNKDINEPAIITATLFKFNENLYSMNFSFNIKGGIVGDFFVKGNKLMEINDRNKSIVEMESVLKNKVVNS
jgi:hypothetical protein